MSRKSDRDTKFARNVIISKVSGFQVLCGRSGVIKKDDKNEIRLYVLGRLDEANEERLEVRLLTEPSFVEEFDTVVDEVTDQYVRGEIEGDELKRLEQYFLRARERQLKARFASVLLEHASATRTNKVVPVKSVIERLLAFFSPQNPAFKFATTAAVLVLAVGIYFVAFRRGSTPRTFAQIELSVTHAERAEGEQAKSLKLPAGTDGAKIVLSLPEQGGQYQSYRVEMQTRDGVKTPLEVTDQNSVSVTAIAPASVLKRGSYAIQLTGIKADGSTGPIPGSYYFRVE